MLVIMHKTPRTSLAASQSAVTLHTHFTFRRCAAGCYENWYANSHNKSAKSKSKDSLQKSGETTASQPQGSRLFAGRDTDSFVRSFSTARNSRSAGSSLLTSPRNSSVMKTILTPQVPQSHAVIKQEKPVDYYAIALQRYAPPPLTAQQRAEAAKRAADRSIEEDISWLK